MYLLLLGTALFLLIALFSFSLTVGVFHALQFITNIIIIDYFTLIVCSAVFSVVVLILILSLCIIFLVYKSANNQPITVPTWIGNILKRLS